MINEEAIKNYSMKILFGPMFGCELHLPAHDYFLIINLPSALSDKPAEYEHAVSYALNTLYIPCEQVSPNITLSLSNLIAGAEHNCFGLEIFDEDGGSNRATVKENSIFTHKHIKFAIKPSDTEWSDEVNHYQAGIPNAEQVSNDNHNLINKKKNLIYRLFCGLILAAIILVSILFFNRESDSQRITNINEVFSGAPSSLDIIKGREDNKIYVLARNFRGFEWAKKALDRLSDQQDIAVILLSDKTAELIGDLVNQGYPALQFNFSSSETPILAISKPLTAEEQNQLKSYVLQKIAFAKDIRFIIRTREQLINDAQQGIDRLNLSYRLIKTATGYSLIIRDSLSDNSLNSLHDFIQSYYQQWGSSVISFSINLDEDWLKNKSYVDSDKGYLFLNPRHWYFPINKKEL